MTLSILLLRPLVNILIFFKSLAQFPPLPGPLLLTAHTFLPLTCPSPPPPHFKLASLYYNQLEAGSWPNPFLHKCCMACWVTPAHCVSCKIPASTVLCVSIFLAITTVPSHIRTALVGIQKPQIGLCSHCIERWLSLQTMLGIHTLSLSKIALTGYYPYPINPEIFPMANNPWQACNSTAIQMHLFWCTRISILSYPQFLIN